jgi:hypothetical protein
MVMAMHTMKLAVLTSGGDSAGMNAAVRSVVKAGILKYVDQVSQLGACPILSHQRLRDMGGP